MLPANLENHSPQIAGRAGELVAMADRVVITCDQDAEKAADLLKFIKTARKKADEELKSVTGPIKAAVKVLEGKFKMITNPLDEAEGKVKGALLSYEQERRRREEEARKAAEEAARLAAQQQAEATIFDDPIEGEAPAPVDLPVVKEGPIRGDYGSTVSVVKRWTYEVTDIQALANARPELVEAVSALIRKEISAGVREIPGLRIFQEESISAR